MPLSQSFDLHFNKPLPAYMAQRKVMRHSFSFLLINIDLTVII